MGLFSWLFRSGAAASPADDDDPEGWEEAGRGRAKNILGAYPDTHVIYLSAVQLSGITFRKREFFRWSDGRNLSVQWEREPENEHDRNAIKVFGVSDRGREFIGYVPKDIAKKIAKSGMSDQLHPRLRRIFQSGSDDGDPYCEVTIQVTGPRDMQAHFFGLVPKLAKARKPTKQKATNDPSTPAPPPVNPWAGS